jgi:hypothetical protein
MKRTKVEIDPAIHAKAKVRAKACRMTLKGWLERLIEAELKNGHEPTFQRLADANLHSLNMESRKEPKHDRT